MKSQKQLEASRAWRSRNKERIRNYNLLYNHGITSEDYNKIFNDQSGCCALCERHTIEVGVRGLHVDHSHVTMRIRGLLCIECNQALGKLGDTEEALLKAYNYVKETK